MPLVSPNSESPSQGCDTGSGGAVVAFAHLNDSERDVVEAVCGRQRFKFIQVVGSGDFDFSAQSGMVSAAVIGVGDPAQSSNSNLETISRLRNLGISVIACGDRIAQRTVGARCKALLAGAKTLLDSSGPDFRELLASALCTIHAKLDEEQKMIREVLTLARSRGIVGESKALFDAFRTALQISRLSDLPVLITGESGTGKELFASALHAMDPKRRNGPFVPVNCAAINPALAESEFFGHVRGAFTGAHDSHAGYFLAARGGVLFLDEVGELTLEMQAKLLRVLQERRAYRVGSNQETPVDIRVIAATNQDLGLMINEKRFRKDLFHRLNMLPLPLPSLKDRRDDIPLLIAHFVDSLGGIKGIRIEPDLVEALSHLELPGNIRELRNMVTAALAIRADDGSLGLKDLSPGVWRELALTDYVVPPPGSSPQQQAEEAIPAPIDLNIYAQTWNLEQRLCQYEREIIMSALKHTKFNQSRAAHLLGITPRCVYNKLRRHHLSREMEA